MKYTELMSKSENPYYPEVCDVDPKEVLEKGSQLYLVDVRQHDEFKGELGHVEGAKLVVLDTLPEHLGQIPKDQTVVFICRSGGRSARATAFALQNGFKEVYNMKGGMLLWNELNLPRTK